MVGADGTSTGHGPSISSLGVIAVLRRLRHGPLRRFSRIWTALGSAYRWTQQYLGWPKSVRRVIGPYGPFRLNARFAFSNYDSWGQAHNAGFAQCIEACRGKSCVLDIGAHIGLVTLPASRAVGVSGQVFAFEPASANLRYLRDHLQLNDVTNVEVMNCIVGESEVDAVPFFEQVGDSGLNSIVAESDKGTFKKTMRRQISVDGFCAQRKVAPAVLKIDVEGAEIGVLRGAKSTLLHHKPIVFLSVHPRQIEALGGSVEELKTIISEVSYVARDCNNIEVDELGFGEYVLTASD